MCKEEIELIPSGLISCLIGANEVRILKISPYGFTFRVSEEIDNDFNIKLAFHQFDQNTYNELLIEDFQIIDVINKEFYVEYKVKIESDEYKNNVREAFNFYSKYAMLKAYGDENEFSKFLVNYPNELDYTFSESYEKQKKEWFKNIKQKSNKIFEMAISLDNYNLYNKYLELDKDSFKEFYFNSNYINDIELRNNKLSRLYIGNEFCHNLFPKKELLESILKKSLKDKLSITIVFTYMRECFVEKTKDVIECIYNFCKENKIKIEVVINDWGMIKLLEDRTDYISINLGLLLNKRKKDPRIKYKKGCSENHSLISENSLNSSEYVDFLKENKITRFEYESCGYRMKIAVGNHSLHIPFYQTNTSQFCTLYAVCTTNDRGNQKLVKNCSRYCEEYVFLYPKHLKAIGRYNSIFGFDDSILSNTDELNYYLENGIDRIVLNF